MRHFEAALVLSPITTKNTQPQATEHAHSSKQTRHLITDKIFASAVVVSSPILLTRLLPDMWKPAGVLTWANPNDATPLADSL